MLRVCVLSPSYENSTSVFKNLDPPCDPSVWMVHLPQYEFESHFIRKATAVTQIRALVQSKKFDVFINLCDGAWDEDRAGIEVVQALERFGVPFTGADSAFYEPSKEHQKMVAVYEGIKTPAFAFAYTAQDVEAALETLPRKVIVKHFNGYSSVGMTKDSVCETPDDLRREASRFIEEFGGALLEEFIEGREATVLVQETPGDPLNPVALTPVECCFPPGETFKHFDLKWNDFDGLQWRPFEDPALVQELQSIAVRTFVGLRGVSYGRVDLRICARTGTAYFLEMNPNCGIFYPPDAPGSADCILNLVPTGHAQFTEHIIQAALARHRARLEAAPKCAVRYHPRLGHHLCAVAAIPEGGTVLPLEEAPYHLVSRAHVEKHWAGQKRQWFGQYGWPVGNRLFVMWSPRPEEWRPINHSCDPNAWFAEQGGLDVVARRPISAGEEITMDYATFCTENMAAFDCKCGAAACRSRIQGTDYLSPALRALYGTHMSDFILSREDPCPPALMIGTP